MMLWQHFRTGKPRTGATLLRRTTSPCWHSDSVHEPFPPPSVQSVSRMTNREIEFCSHAGNLSLVRRFVRKFLNEQGL